MQAYKITGDATTGGAGASGSTTKTAYVITGRIVGVGIIGQGSPPNTTDIIVRGSGLTGVAKVPILTITNYSADGWYQPFALKDGVADGNDIAANYVEPTIHDGVEVVVAQANDGDSVDVVLLVADD